MQMVIQARLMDLTPALRAYVETRFSRLSRRVDFPLHVEVLLRVHDTDHIVEASTRPAPGKSLYVEGRSPDVYSAIDLAVDKLDRVLLKHCMAAAQPGE